MREPETIAVLGAGGTMGFAMARNMARAGLSVRAWNRTRAKAEPLAEHGDAYVAGTPAEAVRGATITLTMLADAEAVMSAIEQAIPALESHPEQHPLRLQMPTIGESATSLVDESAPEHGLGLPVLEAIAERLNEAAIDHADEDFSGTYLTSPPSPDRAA